MQQDESETRPAIPAGDAAAPAAGAPPCITAPATCNPRILRHGIDSLYVSYPGRLHEHREKQLRALKECAQSKDEMFAAGAQLPLGDHLFQVRSRGRRRFPYVLQDHWFDIALSGSSAVRLPMAHVQIGSEFITAVGIPEAMRILDAVIGQLGLIDGDPKVSRSDHFADFAADLDLSAIPREAWVTRARNRAAYGDLERDSGLAFGLGGSLSVRIYDKTHEISISKKEYLRPLWTQAGWLPHERVWRLEFQIKREVLTDLMCSTVQELLDQQPSLWRYLTGDWLRLTTPDPEDSTRSRWPNHPLWDVLSKFPGNDAPTLARISKSRVPSDQTLFKNGIWGLTSFMAREGITDFGEGIANYLRKLEYFHGQGKGAQALEAYVERKVLAKGRRFNTIKTNHEPE